MSSLFKLRPIGYRMLATAVIAIFIAGPPASYLVSSPVSADQLKEVATLTGEHQKQQFALGERVEITKANIGDDIFAMGRDLVFDNVSAKNIIAAGLSHSLSDISAEDLILLGGQLELSGTIKDDMVAAVCPFCPFHGRLHLTKTTRIDDDARLAGRDIAIDGRIGGNLYAFAQNFRLAGEIAGNAKIEADRIVLAPGARIAGDLLYAGANKPEVASGAVVVGEIRQIDTEFPFSEGIPDDWIWYAVAAVIGVLLALFLLGAALQLVVPGVLFDAANTAVDRPWGSIGRGLAIAILAPGIAALLMATIIGVPVGIIIMAAFIVLLALAYVTIAYCIGLYIRRSFGRQNPAIGYGARVLWTTTGMIALGVVGLIPFVGWAISLLALVAGIGAIAQRLGPVFRSAEAASAQV